MTLVNSMAVEGAEKYYDGHREMWDQRGTFTLMGEIMVHQLADGNKIIERKKVNDVTARGEFSFCISD